MDLLLIISKIDLKNLRSLSTVIEPFGKINIYNDICQDRYWNILLCLCWSGTLFHLFTHTHRHVRARARTHAPTNLFSFIKNRLVYPKFKWCIIIRNYLNDVLKHFAPKKRELKVPTKRIIRELYIPQIIWINFLKSRKVKKKYHGTW